MYITKLIKHRHFGYTPRTDTYRINPYTITLCYLCRRYGSNVACVVGTVGEQYYHFRLAFCVLDAVYGSSQTQTDSRTVLYDTEIYLFEEIYQRGVIARNRALRETLAGKDHKSEIVVRTREYKLYADVFCRLQSVGRQVACQHRPRYIHSYHYIDTLSRGVAVAIRRLRTCQDYD